MINQSGSNQLENAILMVPGMHYSHGFLVMSGFTGFSITAADEPRMIVDGVPVDLEDKTGEGVTESPALKYLKQIDGNVIDFIEILSGPQTSNYGIKGGRGVILINSKPQTNIRDKAPTVIKFYPRGHYHASPFLFPDYDKNEMKNSSSTDDRSTIYWNGNILTNKQGNASVSFFTADASSSYTLTLTGVSAAGDALYKKIHINRK